MPVNCNNSDSLTYTVRNIIVMFYKVLIFLYFQIYVRAQMTKHHATKVLSFKVISYKFAFNMYYLFFYKAMSYIDSQFVVSYFGLQYICRL